MKDSKASVRAVLVALAPASHAVGVDEQPRRLDREQARAVVHRRLVRAALEALPARFEGIFTKHMLVRDGTLRDSASGRAPRGNV